MPTMAEMQSYGQYAAAQYGVPWNLFNAQIQQESSWNPTAWGPPTKYGQAYGLGQLLSGTAGDLGVNRMDWQQNLLGSAAYLRQQYDAFGSWELALSAYNSGPAGSERFGRVANNPETLDYVSTILGNAGMGAPGAGDANGAARPNWACRYFPDIGNLFGKQLCPDNAWEAGAAANNAVQGFITRGAVGALALLLLAAGLFMLAGGPKIISQVLPVGRLAKGAAQLAA